MGCKGLWAFLNDVIKIESIDKLKGKPIIIDAMLYIYKYIIGIRNNGRDILNSNGKNINHIFAIYNLVKIFSENGILPICVFDGKAPEIKKECIEKRKQIIGIADEKCKAILEAQLEAQLQNQSELNDNNLENDDTEYIKNFKKSISINTEIINDCKYFLSSLGIPYINSIGEADSQCTILSHYYKNVISGVLSEDSDVLIFGGHKLYRDFDFKSNTIKSLDLNDIIAFFQKKVDTICSTLFKKSFEFTINNFIDFTIILGNDYNHGIRCGGGNNREKIFELFVLNNCDIIKFIAHLYQINNILGIIKYYIPENFIEKWVYSKNNYSDAEIINPADINIYMNKPNRENIKKFLQIENFNCNQIDTITNIANILYDNYSINKYTFDTTQNIKFNMGDVVDVVDVTDVTDVCINNKEDEGWQVVTNKKSKKFIY